jgi:hypothetical protein
MQTGALLARRPFRVEVLRDGEDVVHRSHAALADVANGRNPSAPYFSRTGRGGVSANVAFDMHVWLSKGDDSTPENSDRLGTPLLTAGTASSSGTRVRIGTTLLCRVQKTGLSQTSLLTASVRRSGIPRSSTVT